MTTQEPEPFEAFDKETTAALTDNTKKPDPTWVERIGKLEVGHGFRMKRLENETVRQLKLRINRAAEESYRTLDWFPEQKNVKAEDVTSYIVKVRAHDAKAQREAEEKARLEAEEKAKTNGITQEVPQASQEAPQPTEGTESTPDTSNEENAPVGPRSARNR